MNRRWIRFPLRYVLAAACLALMVAFAIIYSEYGSRSRVDALPSPIRRLLVLPLDTHEAKSYGRSVGVELADEIADSLAHVEHLQISGRRSAEALAATHTPAIDAGRKLGADAVLSGEVAERPEGLRVTVRLMAVKDGRELWTRVFERPQGDTFAAQSAIAAAVVHHLIELVDREGAAGTASSDRDSRDSEAYQLYLRGAHQLRLRGEDSLRRAVDLFSAAARRDPSYARAQAGLGLAYALLPSYSYEDPAEMYALADKALTRADELSHSRLESAGTRGYLGFMRGRWIEAETAFRTAIVADPNDPDVRQMYSQLLGAVGRIESALTQARIAEEIDPLAPVVAERLGILNLWLGHDAEADRYAALARELGLEEAIYPETTILLKLHQYHDVDAANDLRALQQSLHRPYGWVEPTLNAYRHAEKRPAAIALLDRALANHDISARLYFGAMVLLEDSGRALSSFITMPGRDVNDLEFLFSAEAAVVRRDPAFGEFIKKMGIEAYWDRFGWPGICRRDLSQITCH